MAQQEQASQTQREGPPPGWRYPDQAKHRSRLRGWLATVWKGTKDNAALASLVGVVLTLLVTTVLSQQEGLRQQNLEFQRAKAAAQVAEQQAQQESLQAYLGDMGELILRDTSPLPEASPDDAVSQLARAKTLTVLGGLGPQNKGIVLQFLGETQLIQSVGEKLPIIVLIRADLRMAELERAELNRANMSHVHMSGADLSAAYLVETDLSDANLSDANLSDARGVTEERLIEQTDKLEGATMLDGSKHP